MDTVEVRKEDTQEVFIVMSSGKSFADVRAATVAMSSKGWSGDDYTIVDYQGGKAIRPNDTKAHDKAQKTQLEKAKKASAQPPSSGERCWHVSFHDRTSKNDPINVVLSVNGETVVMKRETEVILPDRYLECADHATYQVFEQTDGPRKTVGSIRKYPYRVLGEATWEEYNAMLRKGTEDSRKHQENKMQQRERLM